MSRGKNLEQRAAQHRWRTEKMDVSSELRWRDGPAAVHVASLYRQLEGVWVLSWEQGDGTGEFKAGECIIQYKFLFHGLTLAALRSLSWVQAKPNSERRVRRPLQQSRWEKMVLCPMVMKNETKKRDLRFILDTRCGVKWERGLTPRFGAWTSKWLILPSTEMNKNKEGMHFSPFSTNRRSIFFSKSCVTVLAYLIYFDHFLSFSV